jgi:hypothetical protein
VWTVKVAVHVVDHDGALLDACTAAALAALLTFRHPAVSVGGDTGTEVTIMPTTVKEAVKLNVHLQPLALTFAFIAHPDGEGEELLLVDPSYKEQVSVCERALESHPTRLDCCFPYMPFLRGVRAPTVFYGQPCQPSSMALYPTTHTAPSPSRLSAAL